MLDTLFGPSRWLMRRLSFTWKFVAIAVVLVLPLAYSLEVNLDQYGNVRDFAGGERRGAAYVTPLNRLVVALVQARSEAVAGEAPSSIVVSSALDDVVAVDRSYGAEMQTGTTMSTLHTAVQAAIGGKTAGADAFTAWTAAVDAANAVMMQVDNASNLILDPQADTYSLMDAAMVRLPSLVDSAGKATDLARIGGDQPDRANQYAADVNRGNLDSSTAALGTDIDTVFATTKDSDVKGDLDGPRAAAADATKALAGAIESGRPVADLAAAGTKTIHALTAVADPAAVALDRALGARISHTDHDQRTTLTIVALALLGALYCFGGLALGVSQSVKAMLRTLRNLAEGRFLREPLPKSRDELGTMAAAMTETIEQTRSAMSSISESARTLLAAAGDVSAVSASISQSAETTTMQAGTAASGTEEMSAAINEIAGGASRATEIGESAQTAAVAADATITTLGRRSQDINAMVDTISEIAAQTNLLALNATIEAARAGEAGKGFAVVADEVKNLATETAKATDTIVEMVRQIQQDASAAVDAIGNIRAVITRVNETQQSIGAAVEEQAVTTSEISRAVQDVASVAGATSDGAGRLSELATKLNTCGEELRDLVGRYQFD